MLQFELRSEGSLIRTMIGSRVGVSIAGATIGISGVLIGVLLVVKFSGYETEIKVGPTLGGGAGVRGEVRVFIG